MFITDPLQDLTVTHSQGADSIFSIQSEEAFNLTGGSLSVVETSAFFGPFTLGATLGGAGDVHVLL